MIAVTASTGQLGRLVVPALLERGVPAGEIVAGARDLAKAGELAALGVHVREADYDRPETLPAFLDGVDVLLLISSSAMEGRVPQHGNAVDAAAAAGVRHLVYTSILGGHETTHALAPDHQETERLIARAGFPATTILRNGWYTENYAPSLEQARETGVLLGGTGDGRVASASRADYAAATAEVLVAARRGEADGATVLELSGDTAWTFGELAAAMGEALGREVAHRDVSEAEHGELLRGAGLPPEAAAFVARLDADIRDGLLAATPGDLSRVIGRATTPMPETIRALAAGA